MIDAPTDRRSAPRSLSKTGVIFFFTSEKFEIASAKSAQLHRWNDPRCTFAANAKLRSVGSALSPQRGNLIGVVHGNDAHVLVALVFLQTHVLRAVHVADSVHLEELVRVIDQVLVDDRFPDWKRSWESFWLMLMLPVADALPIMISRILRPRLLRDR
jgi:hypothetical protein